MPARSARNGRPSRGASVFPTLAAQLEGCRIDRRTGGFVECMEAGTAERLAGDPERMKLPLGKIVLVKNGR